MRDKARELLERALRFIDLNWDYENPNRDSMGLRGEIRDYLASEKQDQPESVAIRDAYTSGLLDGKALTPRKPFVRLTDEEICIVMDNVLEGGGWIDVARAIEDALEEKNK